MYVCFGVKNALNEFKEIRHILMHGSEIAIIVKAYEAWYVEHLHSFELTFHKGKGHSIYYVHQLKDHTIVCL